MNNSFSDDTPEQKLAILRAEIITPLVTIQGCTALIKKHFEGITPQFGDLMECIDGIAKSADKIKLLLDKLDRGN